MKKLFLLLLCLAVLIVGVACSDYNPTETNNHTETNNTGGSETTKTTGESETTKDNGGKETSSGLHTHTFSAWSTTTEPTCAAQGKQTRTCSSCGFSEYASLDAVSHKYNDGEIVTAATCNQKGVKKFTCTVETCKHSYTEEFELPTFTATELYEQSVKYVGEIVTYDKTGDELSLGTGFVMSSDGKIITNYHVIDGAYSANITINNTKYTIASVLAYDADIDLAVLKINATGLTAATICKKSVSTGSTVYAIGSSRGMTNTYSQGIVTQADRVVDGVSHIQHDASITHGNSGGPLINIYGEVIGINTWGISDSQNLNFAVFAGELDNLVYGSPMTLAQLYESINTPYGVLLDWLYANATSVDEEYIGYYYYDNSGYQYSLVYNSINGRLTLNFGEFLDDISLYFQILLEEDTNIFEYGARFDDYNDSSYNSSTFGYIYGNSFNSSSRLTYVDHYGSTYKLTTLMQLYSLSADACLSWLDWLIDTRAIDTSLYELGFTAYN